MNIINCKYRIATIVLMSIILTSCANNRPINSKSDYAYMMADFHNGKAQLNCVLSCAGIWYFNRDEIYLLYVRGQWENLAAKVIQIGHPEDLGYFWLGRSAESLGYRDAAASYYRAALALNTLARNPNRSMMSCENVRSHGCFDIDVFSEAQLRISVLNQRTMPNSESVAPLNISRDIYNNQDKLNEESERETPEPMPMSPRITGNESGGNPSFGTSSSTREMPQPSYTPQTAPNPAFDIVLPPARR